MRLNSEIFLLPKGKGERGTRQYIAYAPLRRVLVRIQPEHIPALKRVIDGKPRRTDESLPLMTALVEAGVINGEEEKTPGSFVGRPYCPNGVTLFLSDKCGMACRYCYAGQSGTKRAESRSMPLSLAFAAIDTVIENAEKRGVKYFSVGFHGGGEPTADWATFKAVVERATRRAAETRTRVHLSMSTGAAFSPQKAKWIAERFTNVSISLDGPPRIQDRNRPLKSGAPSSPFVRRSLEIFDKMDFGYAIQSTVVADQVEEMPETIRWFAANTRAKTVKFEPVSDAGSFSGEKKLVPTASAFARNFIAACEIGKRLGLTVNFSGVRLQGGPVAAFCGAFTEPFSVTPEGEVSACFEAFENKGPYSDLFIFGKWDERTGKFTFDLEKLEVLRGRNIYNLTSCRNCFCKYSCGGDCATRNCRSPRNGKFSAADLLITGARCETIREITRHSLIGILKAAPRGQSTAKIPIEKKGGDVLGEF